MLFVSLITGCATYQSKVSTSRTSLQNGQFSQALQELKPLADADNGDQLVYLLDYATALQIAGQLEDSSKVFLKADKLAENLDYHSVSRVAGSMVFNEEMVQYKGDTFEKIFINAFLAMNFAEQNKLDDALVETRRLNEKYVKYRLEQTKTKEFELNPFAKYLSAVLWEADGKFDDAYIAYSEAYKLSPTIEYIKEDLIRASKRARRMDDYKKWKEDFPEVEEKSEWYDRTYGELVVIYQQGWGPRKEISAVDRRFPELRPVYSQTQKANVLIQNGSSKLEPKSTQSKFVYNVEQAAIKTLADDAAALLVRRIGAFATKEILADQVRQKNELLGALTQLTLHATDRADLRQWSTLPQTIQMVKVPLKAGTYSITIQGLDFGGQPTADRVENKSITIKGGRKVFINWRSLR